MRSIMILNAKGGSGKTTLATNLASFYADQGLRVTLADFDSQSSSLDWLAQRPPERPAILGIAAWKHDLRPAKDTERLIIDAPARVHGKELTELLRHAETVIIPVLPSSIDMRSAADFIEHMLAAGRVVRNKVKLAVVANRVRESTLAFHALEQFLAGQDIPCITSLRDSQNYVKAAERGLGIAELPAYLVEQDLEQWAPLLKWLNSKKSVPG